MDLLVKALGPVFVASFALQRLLDLLDPVLNALIRRHREWILSATAFVVGLLLTILLNLGILQVLGVGRLRWLDALVTALFISGGTKWLDDLLKIVRYRRLVLKTQAANAAEDAKQG